ncbi:MAG: EAL domain-containing protein [Ideonella sp.]
MPTTVEPLPLCPLAVAVLSTPVHSAAGADLPVDALAGDTALVRFVMEQLPLGLCVFDGQDRLMFCNQRYLSLWGLPDEISVPGTSFAEIMARTRGIETARSRDQPQPGHGSAGTRRREWLLDDGRTVEVVVSRLPDGSCVALHEDVTQRRCDEARVAHLALHDTLTGLPNRNHLREGFDDRLKRHARGEDLAMLCVDLDRFKAVNDSHGHLVGDRLLQEVAQRLRHCARETDLISRLGGDEFAIVHCGAAQPAAATKLAQRLVAALGESFEIDGLVLNVGASIGIAIAPFDGEDSETLHRNADLALNRAKGDGRATFRFFEPEFDRSARARRGMEAELRLAIEREEFELLYQPQIDMGTGQVSGLEALLRWHHPLRGLVAPIEFISLAEETGLIAEIGRWVLHQACREAMRWDQPVRVAVNVSAVQFRKGSLLRDVNAALLESGLPPNRLELEITESVMLDDSAQAAAALRELHERGVGIAMDDFGTGYSSLSLLRSFPFDRIKIDRSFVRDLGVRDDALSIIRAVVSLGRSLAIAITVEGVETEQQLQSVRAEGCDEAQGYYFSRPVPVSDLPQLLDALNASGAGAPLASLLSPCSNKSSM